jgi:hypothetical protein
MSTLHNQDELVIPHNQDITLQNQLSTEAVDKPGLANLESDSRSRLEVGWLFFAQGDYVTDSRYRTETYRKCGRGLKGVWGATEPYAELGIRFH